MFCLVLISSYKNQVVVKISEKQSVHAFSAIGGMHGLTAKVALVFLGKGFSVQGYILISGMLTQAVKRAC